MRSVFRIALAGVAALAVGHGVSADSPPAKGAKNAPPEAPLVERVIAARKEYHKSLALLYDHYRDAGDKERARWVEDEVKGFHLMMKPSYRLDVHDVPPATLEARENIKAANDMFKTAEEYRTKKASGDEYILNQRRAEIIYHEILARYPTSDKIADVAYELGEMYEGKAYKQYDRAAAYFERACQWRKGTRTDARLRAARLYDKTLSERTKAIEMYREVIANDANAERIREAEKRLAELTSTKR